MNSEYQHSPEEYDEDGLTPEQREYANGMMTLPESQPKQPAPEAERRDYETGVAEFQRLIDDFEAKYPLDQLNTITYLTQEDAPNHPLREPARQAIIPIYKLLNDLKYKTNIPTTRHDELKAEYLRLSKAIGYVERDNKVRH